MQAIDSSDFSLSFDGTLYVALFYEHSRINTASRETSLGNKLVIAYERNDV